MTRAIVGPATSGRLVPGNRAAIPMHEPIVAAASKPSDSRSRRGRGRGARSRRVISRPSMAGARPLPPSIPGSFIRESSQIQLPRTLYFYLDICTRFTRLDGGNPPAQTTQFTDELQG